MGIRNVTVMGLNIKKVILFGLKMPKGTSWVKSVENIEG